MSCSDPPRGHGGRVEASFVATAAGTVLAGCAESGSLRLRRLRGRDCEAVLVNTAGGIVGGDGLAIAVAARAGAAVAVGTAAAEKCYRSSGPEASVATRLALQSGASLHWLPQELILFDGARLARTTTIEMAEDACFLGVEMVVFGRLARGETMREGRLRDGWRLHRGGRLVFADETLVAAPIDVALDRPALGGGARAAALLVAAGGLPSGALDAMRAAMERSMHEVAGGAGLRDGVLVARLAAAAPERLRRVLAALVAVLRPAPPRSWS